MLSKAVDSDLRDGTARANMRLHERNKTGGSIHFPTTRK